MWPQMAPATLTGVNVSSRLFDIGEDLMRAAVTVTFAKLRKIVGGDASFRLDLRGRKFIPDPVPKKEHTI